MQTVCRLLHVCLHSVMGHSTKTCHFPFGVLFNYLSIVFILFKDLFGLSTPLPVREICCASSGYLIYVFYFPKIINMHMRVLSIALPTPNCIK